MYQTSKSLTARLTKHGKKQVVLRCGFKGKRNAGKKAEKLADRALNRGVTHTETKGRLNNYLNALYLKYRKASNLRIFDRMVFVFDDDVLITVLYLPPEHIFAYEAAQRVKNLSFEQQDKRIAS